MGNIWRDGGYAEGDRLGHGLFGKAEQGFVTLTPSSMRLCVVAI